MTTLVVAREDGVISVGCDGLSDAGGFIVGQRVQKWIFGDDCALGMACASVLQSQAERRKTVLSVEPLLNDSPPPEEVVDRLKDRWSRWGVEPKKEADDNIPWYGFNGIYVRRMV